MRCFVVLSLMLVSPLLLAGEPTKTLADFGVVGDGKADDTAAIQAAVNAKLGDLRFTKGTYRLTKPILIELDKVGRTSIHGSGVARIEMHGPGPAFRIVGTHGGTAAPHSVKPNVWQRQSTPLVDGIEIVGHHTEANGIEATGTMQLTVSRVVVRDANHAIHLVNRNRNVVLSECHLYDNHGIGVFLDHLNLHQINIANCHISYNDGGGVVAKHSEIRNLQIGTCDIEGNMGDDDSAPTANVWLDSTDSSIGEVAIVGCTIQHAHNAPNSANIRINGRSTKRKHTEELRHGNITIADNVMSDVHVNLHLENVRAATITGNTMWKGYTRNAIFSGCKNVVMSGNVFDRNPRYHYGDGAQAKLGLLFRDCQDFTLSGNQLYGPVTQDAAVVMEQCRRFNVNALTILDYGRTGLLLKETVDSQFVGSMIRDDREDAEGVTVREIDTNGVRFVPPINP